MTEGTRKEGLQIARLDRKQPPPGFDLRRLDKALQMTVAAAGVWGPRALGVAWTIHQAENDPPGCEVARNGPAVVWEVIGTDGEPHEAYDRLSVTRARAWAWYWRRVDLVLRMEALTDPRYRPQAPAAWPDALTWSDELVKQVEKDIAEVEATAAMKAQIAEELYAIVAPFKGKAKTPQTTGNVVAIMKDLLAKGPRGTTEVKGGMGPDGMEFTVTTSDRGLIELWANAGLVDDPAALGMIRVADGWMWPFVVVMG